MKKNLFLLTIAFCFSAVFLAAQETKNTPKFEPIPNLPNVLILGDSISIGYTPPVRELLQSEANIYRPEANCGNTKIGLKNLDRWLDTKQNGGKKWDVIHFNWGLWDLTYRNPPNQDNTGVRDKINGGISFTPEQYGENLEKIVQRLEKTGAKLIWGNISLIPEGEGARVVGDDVRFNAVATEIMKKHNIPTDDIYKLTACFDSKLFAAPGDVHYTNDGYKKIAEQVAEHIKCVLKTRVT
ncbi:MAG: SGNH/GDSL hydrolase family protein [Planctomycetaceae bacterium]|nr:SGNH/GDSL hydrolase family protein [Planctomycetaceae bacterium]